MDLKLLNGKTILITGATFGIGEALTRRLMQYQVRLILVARTIEKLQQLEHESQTLPAEVSYFVCDLYNEESISQLCTNLKDVRIDYFVSNAGKSIMRSLGESKFSDYQRTMALNYLAPVQIISSLLEKFSTSKTHIVNVSSYNVLMKTPPKWSAYVSSKKAMHSWMQGNAPELRLRNITISNIYLPLVESRMKDANATYNNTRGMSMQRAVDAIIKGIVYQKDYHPWWHIPFQFMMFFINPFWNSIWRALLRQKRY